MVDCEASGCPLSGHRPTRELHQRIVPQSVVSEFFTEPAKEAAPLEPLNLNP
jgi:hypothetical protein